MTPPLRRFLILTLVFGYAFLGGGPSLWALGLAQPPAARACTMTGCACKPGAHPGKGGTCCCRLGAKLLKKYPELAAQQAPAPGACELRSKPCGPLEGDADGKTLPGQLWHTLPPEGLEIQAAGPGDFWRAASSFRSHAPEPPTPVPD